MGALFSGDCSARRTSSKAPLGEALYASSAPRSRIVRKQGEDITQRALSGPKISVLIQNPDMAAQISRTTFFRNAKQDHRECVVTSARIDVCDRCAHWDKSVKPKIDAQLRFWQEEIEHLRAGTYVSRGAGRPNFESHFGTVVARRWHCGGTVVRFVRYGEGARRALFVVPRSMPRSLPRCMPKSLPRSMPRSLLRSMPKSMLRSTLRSTHNNMKKATELGIGLPQAMKL